MFIYEELNIFQNLSHLELVNKYFTASKSNLIDAVGI